MTRNYYSAIGVSEEKIKELAFKYRIKRLALFGSYVRGDEKPDSDIDLLIEWADPPSIDRFMGFVEEAEKAAGKKIDLVGQKSLHWYLKDKILKEAQDLL